jgi:hypothetical protein
VPEAVYSQCLHPYLPQSPWSPSQIAGDDVYFAHSRGTVAKERSQPFRILLSHDFPVVVALDELVSVARYLKPQLRVFEELEEWRPSTLPPRWAPADQ